jgi:DNA repair exonuclease SbcCD ATPase subunit
LRFHSFSSSSQKVFHHHLSTQTSTKMSSETASKLQELNTKYEDMLQKEENLKTIVSNLELLKIQRDQEVRELDSALKTQLLDQKCLHDQRQAIQRQGLEVGADLAAKISEQDEKVSRATQAHAAAEEKLIAVDQKHDCLRFNYEQCCNRREMIERQLASLANNC